MAKRKVTPVQVEPEPAPEPAPEVPTVTLPDGRRARVIVQSPDRADIRGYYADPVVYLVVLPEKD